MVLSEAEQQEAYREAREILKLGEKWQQLMPGEKRPNFERAAKLAGARFASVEVALQDGPKSFEELMAAVGEVSSRTVFF